MNILWVAFILGIVEGLTEFLPVSSTGHMILADSLMNIHDPIMREKLKTFEVAIQLGAILAVLLLYRDRVYRLLNWKENGPWWQIRKDRLTIVHVLVAISPAMLIGFFFHDFIKTYLFSLNSVLIAMTVGSLWMWFADVRKPVPTAETMDQISYKQAMWIGLVQILSLWSGFSRSGSTMAGGSLAGVGYRAVADFSFFIAIPMMVAATGYDLMKSWDLLTMADLPFFAVGFVTAFVVAWLSVVTFLKWLTKVPLRYFAYYRLVLVAIFAGLVYGGVLNVQL